MKKIITLTLTGVLAIANPAFAQSQNDENIKSDVNAIDKDNAALQKDHDTLARNRAAKAADKANGDYGKQAVDSVKIGANKATIDEKQAEKSADTKILKHHKNEVSEDRGDAQTSTAPARD